MDLQWDDCRVPLSLLDQYEERELWQPLDGSGFRHYPQTPAYSVSTFTSLCELCIIMNEILNNIYTKRNQQHGLESLAGHIKPLEAKLTQWFDALEGHLKFDASNPVQAVPPPSVLSLLYVLLPRWWVALGR